MQTKHRELNRLRKESAYLPGIYLHPARPGSCSRYWAKRVHCLYPHVQTHCQYSHTNLFLPRTSRCPFTGTLVIVGFCSPDINPLGPVQLKVSAAESGLANKSRVVPEHTGALDVAVTTGVAIRITYVFAESTCEPIVLYTVYQPEIGGHRQRRVQLRYIGRCR